MNIGNKKLIAGAFAISVGVLTGCSSSEPATQSPSPIINEVPNTPLPETMVPDVQQPVVQQPVVQVPDVQVPDVQIPDVQVPDTQQPDVMVPDVQVPVVTQPEVAIPDGLIASVAVGTVQGTYYLGTPPEQIGSIEISPLTDGEETTIFISGGSTQIPVSSSTEFTTIFITTDSSGYFQIDLPVAALAADVIATYNTIQLDGEEANIDVSVQSATGDVSGNASLPVASVVVGTGDLQISVSWDTPTDVDLVLLEPDSTLVYFNNPLSDSGGALDLDSNANCDLDNINNENITYENTTPPSGEYIIALTYYSACGVTGPTNYVVTLRYNGETRTFPGVFVPADELNEDTEPTLIATFQIQ